MIAIYPGTFDPLTIGHFDLAERASKMFDTLYVGVSTNATKKTLFTLDERIDLAKNALKSFDNIIVEGFDGLLVDYAKKIGANYIIRGMRAVSDFEYEFQLSLMNRKLNNNIETIFMMPSQENIFLSSTLIKDIAKHGGDLSKFVTKNVEEKLLDKFSNL